MTPAFWRRRNRDGPVHMAGYADPRTTKLYDRRRQPVTHGEVERISYERKMQAPPGEALG